MSRRRTPADESLPLIWPRRSGGPVADGGYAISVGRGIDPVCVVCGKPWNFDDDLHHAGQLIEEDPVLYDAWPGTSPMRALPSTSRVDIAVIGVDEVGACYTWVVSWSNTSSELSPDALYGSCSTTPRL